MFFENNSVIGVLYPEKTIHSGLAILMPNQERLYSFVSLADKQQNMCRCDGGPILNYI
jgi:hypothetical protein